jgi:enoyl-CoA hydratase/carnithine racemase
MRVFDGQALSWEHVGDALEVRLHRAPLNEIGLQTLIELEQVARYASAGAGGARALIWYSDRKGFCAGADLRALHRGISARRQRLAGSVTQVAKRIGPVGSVVERGFRRLSTPLVRREVERFIGRIHVAFNALDTAPLTTIAAVHGVCFGGGFELALTADLIIADKSTRFCFPELRLGLVPGFGGVPRLNRDLGNAVVRDLLLTGRSINGKRAHGVGLVSQLVPRGKALEAARSAAAQAARFDPYTTVQAKRFLKPVPTAELARERALFAHLVTRPEVFDALTRFVENTEVRPYLP